MTKIDTIVTLWLSGAEGGRTPPDKKVRGGDDKDGCKSSSFVVVPFLLFPSVHSISFQLNKS